MKSCPPQPYAVRRLLYGSYTDDRACGACTCGAPQQACSASFHLYAACPGTNDYGLFNGCTQHNPTAVFAITATTQTSGPVACAPMPGAPAGGVTPGDAFTLCCGQ